jgi:hypothetical protein
MSDYWLDHDFAIHCAVDATYEREDRQRRENELLPMEFQTCEREHGTRVTDEQPRYIIQTLP